MKTATVDSKKILKAAQTRRVAGVQLRSGVKAGGRRDFLQDWRAHDWGRQGGI